jgi:outer membrane immunogenic protein
MRKTALAASAAFVIASGAMAMPASAADLDFFQPAPPPLIPTWQGFYIGGHVGYGEATFRGRADVDIFDANNAFVTGESFSRRLRPDGILGGFQAGYNWQMDSFVLGIEGDISFTDWRRSSVLFDTDAGDFGGPFPAPFNNDFAFGTMRTNVDFLASVRGRLGIAFDSLLLYGTGGVAWADASARARLVGVHSGPGPDFDVTRSTNLNDFGFVVGGGASWMVIPQTFSLGVEGLFYFFDKRKTLFDDTFSVAGLGSADVVATARLDDVWVLRARADFHF